MSETQLLHAALKLPARRREQLAEAILGSVKRPSQRLLDSLWEQEAESRVDAYLAGRIKTVQRLAEPGQMAVGGSLRITSSPRQKRR